MTLPPDSAARSNSFKASAGFSAPKTADPSEQDLGACLFDYRDLFARLTEISR